MVKIPKKSDYEKRVHPLVGHEPTQGYIAHADQKHDQIHHKMSELGKEGSNHHEQQQHGQVHTTEQIVSIEGSKPIIGHPIEKQP